MPRNNPGDEMMTQGQTVKQPFQMRTADNAQGNESGESVTAGYGTTTGPTSTGVEYAIRDVTSANSAKPEQINIDYSHENRSAKFKNGEGGAPQYVPEGAKGQYQ